MTVLALGCLTWWALAAGDQAGSFQFAILGDRTGEARPGVYEQAWRELAAQNPAFVVSTGDSIQGGSDSEAEAEWRQWQKIQLPYRRFPLYLAAGNHDIWSDASERLFRQYAGRPLHYGFDYKRAHFTVLDNSRDDELSEKEMAFLESDLREHAAQPVKFILSHRPSWLVNAALDNPSFPLHQLAKKYGARFVIAGHLHQMLHMDLDGVSYVSMASSGGHLRLSERYEDGWFFGIGVVKVTGSSVHFEIRELKPPIGQGRVTALQDWGKAGLIAKAK